jgi:hypothetical protein
MKMACSTEFSPLLSEDKNRGLIGGGASGIPTPPSFRKCIVMSRLVNLLRRKCFVINELHLKYRRNKDLAGTGLMEVAEAQVAERGRMALFPTGEDVTALVIRAGDPGMFL